MKPTCILILLITFATNAVSQVRRTNCFDTEAFCYLIQKESSTRYIEYYTVGGVIDPWKNNIEFTKTGKVNEFFKDEDPNNFSIRYTIDLGKPLKQLEYYDVNNYQFYYSWYTVEVTIKKVTSRANCYMLNFIETEIPDAFFTPKFPTKYELRQIGLELNGVTGGLNEARKIAFRHFIKMYMSIQDHYCSLTFECDEENNQRLRNECLGGRLYNNNTFVFNMTHPSNQEMKELYLLPKENIKNIKDYLIEKSPDYSLWVLGGLLTTIAVLATVDSADDSNISNKKHESSSTVIVNAVPKPTSTSPPSNTPIATNLQSNNNPPKSKDKTLRDIPLDSIGYSAEHCPTWLLNPILEDECWIIKLDSECGEDCVDSQEIWRFDNEFRTGLFGNYQTYNEALKETLEYLLKECCGIYAFITEY